MRPIRFANATRCVSPLTDNPIDWIVREGLFKYFLSLSLPVVAGYDLAGVIEAVGGQVNDLRVGDAVFAMQALNVMGAYAEYAVVDRTAVARKPLSLDFVQAASVPMGRSRHGRAS